MAREKKHLKLDIIKSIIINEFQFLELELNYTYSYKRESNTIFTQSLDVEYNNTDIKRQVVISFTARNSNDEIRYTFTASIIRLPYFKVEDYFSLDTYLKATGKDFPVTIINDFSINDAKSILNNISETLRKGAFNLINGTEWYEKYYPRKD